MKLKKVTVTFEYVIVVEDDATPESTYYAATHSVHEAFKDISPHDLDLSYEEYSPGDVSGWSDDCIPYGGDGDNTIGEYLK